MQAEEMSAVRTPVAAEQVRTFAHQMEDTRSSSTLGTVGRPCRSGPRPRDSSFAARSVPAEPQTIRAKSGTSRPNMWPKSRETIPFVSLGMGWHRKSRPEAQGPAFRGCATFWIKDAQQQRRFSTGVRTEMFMTKKTAIDFHAWADEARQLRAPYEQQLTKILERDRAYQEELCTRGRRDNFDAVRRG